MDDKEVYDIEKVYNDINNIIESSKQNIVNVINNELVMSKWKIGEIIVKYEQNEKIRAEYGKSTLKALSKELTKEFGKGYSRANLQNMRSLYLEYPICQTLSSKLNWSHYCELLSISDKNKRSFN